MKISELKTELKKLASELDLLGETSFVKDIFLIESMLPKEDNNVKEAKLSSKDLDLLKKNLEKSFLR